MEIIDQNGCIGFAANHSGGGEVRGKSDICVLSVKGETDDSDKLNGDVVFLGATGSGLVVVTEARQAIDETGTNHTNGNLTIDIDGRPEDEMWGVKTLTVTKEGSTEDPQTARFLGSGDINVVIPKKESDNGSGYDGSLTVVTSVSPSTSEPGKVYLTKLTLTIENGKITAVKSNSEPETITVLEVTTADVVADVDYTNPNFTKTTRAVYIPLGEETGTPANVFTTTPLSSETT